MLSISNLAGAACTLSIIACSACVGTPPAGDPSRAPAVFYTVTGEIALSRHEPRIAAIQYAAAAQAADDLVLLQRAIEVTADSLQPSLTADIAARWIAKDPASLDAQRAAAQADLDLNDIAAAAAHYRIVLATSPRGLVAECSALEITLAATDNVFGARRLADRLAAVFPESVPVRRMQGFAALRGDDPSAAVSDFSAVTSAAGDVPPAEGAAPDERAGELIRGLWRARVLSGDSVEPLARAEALADGDSSGAARLDYALLLLTAHRDAAATAQFELLTRQPEWAPIALRLWGLVDFQDGKLDAAGVHFAELLTKGKYLDDGFYYLGLIAERHQDLERALRLYAQVQGGDNELPALLRAAALLRSHGAAPAAEQLFDQLQQDEPQRAPEILAARARIYSDAGDGSAALELLAAGAAQYPDSVELRYAIASTYEEQGQLSAALKELRAVVKLRPDDPSALNAYGFTLADHEEHLRHARALIERAYAAAPRNAAIIDSLGWVIFKQGHGDQALPYLRTAYADDRGGDIAAHFGEVLWSQGKQADAERVWSEASALDPDNRLLKATRHRMHADD